MVIAAVVLLLTAVTALAVTGQLTQLTGTAGCVSDQPTTPSGDVCADGQALAGALSAALSPQSDNVYVTSLSGGGAIAAFQRNATTGALTQLSGTAACLNRQGTDPRGDVCDVARAIYKPLDIKVSADGKNVYVAWNSYGGVSAFARDTTTGALTQLAGMAGCIAEPGAAPAGDNCTDGRALGGAQAVAISPDGSNVYVASGPSDSGGIAIFHRDATTGALTQLAGTAGCIGNASEGCAAGIGLAGLRAIAVSADGNNLYVTSDADQGTVAAFHRDTTTGALTQLPGQAGCISTNGASGACATGKALKEPFSLALSRDGKNAYVAAGDPASGAVDVFSRNTTTGALTQLAGTAGCVSYSGTGGACAKGKALNGAYSVFVTAGGRYVYVATFISSAVAVFARNLTSGVLTQLAGTAGCISDTGLNGACTDDRALKGARSVRASGDGTSVYVVASPSPTGSYSAGDVAIFKRSP
jgi:6-phosphogluconolactonase (cycloisomerase 2 family)